MRKTSLVTAMVLVVVSMSAAQITSVRLSEEDNIREAVFRYQFDHNASAVQKEAAAYCLAIGNKYSSPSNAFIRRFNGHKPPVRKVSECRLNKSTGERLVGGKAALTFRITTIRWLSDREVEVDGGYDEGNMSASGNTYKVVKEKRMWTVASDRMISIS